MNSPKERRDSIEISPLTDLATKVCRLAKDLSPTAWLRPLFPVLKDRRDITLEEWSSPEFNRRRAKAVDIYIIGWLVAEIALAGAVCLFGLPLWCKITVVVLAGLRIVDILQGVINVAVFDRLGGCLEDKVLSTARLLVLSFLNFVELSMCFGLIYAVDCAHLHDAGQPATAFYLSIITQLTIGYGDVYPLSYMRIVAATQGVASLIFIALVFGRFVATLPRIEGILDTSRASSESANPSAESPNKPSTE